MRHIAAMLLVWAAGAVGAQDWQRFEDDATLRAFLIAHPLVYETGAFQQFNPSGRTLYRTAETSWGYWRVEGGQYCSQWPPSDGWDCYDVSRDGAGAVRFVDAWGNASVGRVAE